MARLDVSLVTPNPVTITTGGLEPLLFLKAPANQRVVIKSIKISCRGTASTDVPLTVQLVEASTDGTTPTTVFMQALDGSLGETIQTTAGAGTYITPPATVSNTIINRWDVHVQTQWEELIPPGMEYIIEGGGRRLLVAQATTASVAVNAVIIFEE